MTTKVPASVLQCIPAAWFDLWVLYYQAKVKSTAPPQDDYVVLDWISEVWTSPCWITYLTISSMLKCSIFQWNIYDHYISGLSLTGTFKILYCLWNKNELNWTDFLYFSRWGIATLQNISLCSKDNDGRGDTSRFPAMETIGAVFHFNSVSLFWGLRLLSQKS